MSQEIIPRDPSAPEFRQGDTLGLDNRHWFRAKFHHRYRLFFRFSTRDRVIVYVWVNDEFTLRKASSRTDAYAVFKSMLNAGDPPRTLEALLKRAKEMRVEVKDAQGFPWHEGLRVLGAGMTECRIDDARVREPEHKLPNRYPWQDLCLTLKPLVGCSFEFA